MTPSLHTVYDCLVIGGGPAGLSAAIYLARYNRTVCVVDSGKGRWNSHELNENYLGFVDGIHARQLIEIGRKQAERFGAVICNDTIRTITQTDLVFHCLGTNNEYQGKSLILATGVTDQWPEIPQLHDYLGKTLFWCLTCDGFKVRNKQVVVIGADSEAACTSQQLRSFTNQIHILANCHPAECTMSKQEREELQSHDIPVIFGQVKQFIGENGIISEILLSSGKTIPADAVFIHNPAKPNNSLAKSLGVTLTNDGYIEADEEQRTNQPHVYAAGDITRQFSHQIITAAHEGATAAIAVNYDLYEPCQRERS